MPTTTFECKNFKELVRDVNFLILSDLHLDIEHAGHAFNAYEIILRYLKDFKEKEKSWRVDAILIVGDLVDKNKSGSYHLLQNLLQALIDMFELQPDKILFTPGNHDCDISKLSLAFPFLHAALGDDSIIKNAYSDSNIVNNIYTASGKELNEEALKLLQKFESGYFAQWIQFTKKEKYKNPVFSYERKDLSEGLNFNTFYHTNIYGVEVASVNTSFFCNFAAPSNDRNHLFLLNDLIRNFKQRVMSQVQSTDKDLHRPVITMMHHPFYYLHESEHIYPIKFSAQDTERAMINSYIEVAQFSDIILNGHTHGHLHAPTRYIDKVYVVNNGATYYNDKEQPVTFGILKVNKLFDSFQLRTFVSTNDKTNFEEITNPLELPCYSFRSSTKILIDHSLDKEEYHRVELVKSLSREGCKNRKLIEIQLSSYFEDGDILTESNGDNGKYSYRISNGVSDIDCVCLEFNDVGTDVQRITQALHKLVVRVTGYAIIFLILRFDSDQLLKFVQLLKQVIVSHVKFKQIRTNFIYIQSEKKKGTTFK